MSKRKKNIKLKETIVLPELQEVELTTIIEKYVSYCKKKDDVSPVDKQPENTASIIMDDIQTSESLQRKNIVESYSNRSDIMKALRSGKKTKADAEAVFERASIWELKNTHYENLQQQKTTLVYKINQKYNHQLQLLDSLQQSFDVKLTFDYLKIVNDNYALDYAFHSKNVYDVVYDENIMKKINQIT